jgi:hypothetical protein
MRQRRPFASAGGLAGVENDPLFRFLEALTRASVIARSLQPYGWLTQPGLISA